MSQLLRCLVAVCIPCVGPQAQEPRRTEVLFPAKALTRVLPAAVPLPYWTFFDDRPEAGVLFTRLGQPEAEPVLDFQHAARIASWAATITSDRAVDVRPANRGVYLRGSAAQTRTALAAARTIEAHIATPIQLRAAVVRHDGRLKPPTVLDRAQVRGLFEGHEILWSGESSSWNGRPINLGGMSKHPKSRRPVLHGCALCVIPHRLHGTTDLALVVQFAIGEQPAEPRSPLSLASGLFSGCIPHGGGLVCALAGGEESYAIVVSATWPPAQPLPQGVAVFPVSLTVDHHVRCGFGSSRWANPWSPPLEAGTVDDGELQDMLRMRVTPEAWDEVAAETYLGGSLCVVGRQASIDGAAEFVAAQQRHRAQTLELDVHLGEGRSISLPVLSGRPHPIAYGAERAGARGFAGVRAVVRASTADGVNWELRYDGLRSSNFQDQHDTIQGAGTDGEKLRAEHNGDARITLRRPRR